MGIDPAAAPRPTAITSMPAHSRHQDSRHQDGDAEDGVQLIGSVQLRVAGPVAYLTVGAAPGCAPLSAFALGDSMREIGRRLPGNVRLALVRIGSAEDARPSRDLDSDLDWLRRHDLISLAVVDGHLTGDTVATMLSCDIRVVTSGSQIRIIESPEGLLPNGLVRLTDAVGSRRALELLLSGRALTAWQCHNLGLVDDVIAPESMDAALDTWIGRLLRLPQAVATEAKALTSSRPGAAGAGGWSSTTREQAARVRLLSGRDGLVG